MEKAGCRFPEGFTRSDTEPAGDVIVPVVTQKGMIMAGAVRPGIIKIKATVAGDDVRAALAAYHLSRSAAHSHEIYFCEQPAQLGLLPLLDAAVILRLRHDLTEPGDVTVKLRPCRPGQLGGQWSTFRRSADHELRIKAEWAHDRRVVAASLVHSLPGDHLRQALDSRPQQLGRLFSARQRRFLAECASRVDLDHLYLLGPVKARTWRLAESRYDITAERWTVSTPGNPTRVDLLELSVTVEPEDAPLVQPAFLASVSRLGLDPYAFQETKTRHVLQHLATSGPT
jgi:hypothetical protein